MNTLLSSINKLAILVLVIFIISLLFSLPVMWLWNWLMPYLFDLKEISLLHAWGIMILSNILFKPTYPKQSN